MVTYNAFKSPVEIKVDSPRSKDIISYQYDAFGSRATSYYGGMQADKTQRRFQKYYSHDGIFEIKFDRTTNKANFYIYLGGDAYSAPAVLSMEGNTEKYLYLHRDYLGSITLITDDNGNAVEKRHFNAWGQITKYWNIKGQTTIPVEGILLDRGYTGHEHLYSVGLIHMNGRLYDPVLHRFLQPDNYVQDPSNTQNFNRYGYVLNNPLKYTDPSGEFIITAIIIGSIVGAYIGGAQANGTYNPFKWNYSSGKTWLGIVGGALVGGVSGAAGVYVGGLVSSGMTSIGISGGIFGGAASGAGGGLVGGAVFGGIAGGIFTPKGHSIWTGKALPVRQPLQKIDAISKGVNLEVETFRGELSLRQPTQATSIQSEMNLVPVETLDGGIKTLTPGLKIAENKLIQHAHQWGIVEKGSSLTIEQVNLMKNLTNHIYKNSTIIRQGTWGNPMAGGFKDALFFSNGRHIIVTRSDGTMITILKNAMGNKHFNKATTIWTR